VILQPARLSKGQLGNLVRLSKGQLASLPQKPQFLSWAAAVHWLVRILIMSESAEIEQCK